MIFNPTIRERWRWWKWFLSDYHYAGAPWLGKTRAERNRNLKLLRAMAGKSIVSLDRVRFDS